MSKLSKEQEFLMSRIPRWYDVRPNDPQATEKVKKAQTLIAEWNKTHETKVCFFKKAFDQDCAELKEAIYFADSKTALAKVKAIEAKYPRKGC